MSEPEETDRPDGRGVVEGIDSESAAETGTAVQARHSDADPANLSDTGVGLSMGEPNTFEPEEPGPGGPTE
jgi:hypothetical protein